MQFVRGDSTRPQLAQQPMPLKIFVTDVERSQSCKQGQRAAPNAPQRVDDLLQLTAEQDAHKYKRSCVEQGTRRIEKKESRDADARTGRQRWRQSAQARKELRDHDPFHPV